MALVGGVSGSEENAIPSVLTLSHLMFPCIQDVPKLVCCPQARPGKCPPEIERFSHRVRTKNGLQCDSFRCRPHVAPLKHHVKTPLCAVESNLPYVDASEFSNRPYPFPQVGRQTAVIVTEGSVGSGRLLHFPPRRETPLRQQFG